MLWNDNNKTDLPEDFTFDEVPQSNIDREWIKLWDRIDMWLYEGTEILFEVRELHKQMINNPSKYRQVHIFLVRELPEAIRDFTDRIKSMFYKIMLSLFKR